MMPGRIVAIAAEAIQKGDWVELHTDSATMLNVMRKAAPEVAEGTQRLVERSDPSFRQRLIGHVREPASIERLPDDGNVMHWKCSRCGSVVNATGWTGDALPPDVPDRWEHVCPTWRPVRGGVTHGVIRSESQA
jgi:hypothetical protein